MLVRQAGEHLTESLQPYVRYATRHDPSDESWPTLTSLNLSRPANIQRINDTVAYFGNPEVPHAHRMRHIHDDSAHTRLRLLLRHKVLMRVLLDETYEPDLDVLMLAAKHYAQFHFYEEDIAPMARRLTMAL